MKQRVNHIAYLAIVSVQLNSLSNTAKDYILIPKGSHIIDVKLEVEESIGSGEIELGLSNAGLKFFENTSLDSSKLENRFISSSVHTQVKENDSLSLKLSNGSFSGGKVIIKAHYYLPSQIMTEI